MSPWPPLLALLVAVAPATLAQGVAASGEQNRTAFSYTQIEDGVRLQVGEVTKTVTFYGPSIVRVNTHLGEDHWTAPSLAVVAGPTGTPFEVDETTGTLTLSSDALQVVADKETGALTFLNPDGSVLTREREDRPETLREVTIGGEPTYEVEHTFTLDPDESIYGLGQYNEPYYDYRGQEVLMVQTNIGIVVPFLLSTNRYGVLWDIYSKMTFEDDEDGATLRAESAPGGVDYYLVAGETMDSVIAGYRHLTGPAPMFPKAAFGLFMSKERYETQARLLEVARTFRERDYPLDYIVQDWQYWGSDQDGTWSGMIWNPERYPDPEHMTEVLHDSLNLKLMISIWPSVGNDTELAHELDEHGLRYEPLHWISQQARIYDAYSPLGREIYFKHIKSGLLDVGVDALWMDGTEIEVGGAAHDPVAVERDIEAIGSNALGDFTRYLNPYSLVTTGGTYEGQRATSDQRVFTLTRSAWAGQQRYAAAAWSGDTFASWQTLRDQISGGLNVAMAGLPYWTQDIGGFFVQQYDGGEQNPVYRELFARWNQFGVFNPIYRIHGTNIEREPYLFEDLDPEVYASLLDATHLRYRLLPYIYGLAWKTTADGYTMMRGLPMDFPDDPAVRSIDDAFMFGPAFLVHPVTRAMYEVGTPPPPTLPASALRTPDGDRGLAVTYFSDLELGEVAGTAVDATVDHRWPEPPLADPPPGLDRFENFSARWEGTLIAPESGEYEIGLEGDDGFRLWLSDRLVVDDWTFGAARYKGARVELEAGQGVPVKIEYFQGGQDRVLRLGWHTPSALRALETAEVTNVVETYLPAGDWVDFWTHERFAGGTTVEMAVPLNVFPLYVRAGSIVPMGPVVQYATERPEAPYEIRVYPGADGRFTVYEDDDETYAYEDGARATYDLVWDDDARTLTVGDREGSFPGMVASRELRVVLAEPGQPAGLTEATASDARTVTYRGDEIVVRFERAPADSLGNFRVERDLYLAHFDSKTDVDDIHSVAAVATMLADPRFSEVQYHAVAGAYGTQEGLYVPANDLFEDAFGEQWSDAHADFDGAVREVTTLVVRTLEDGGTVWIAEAGQSDFTAALLRSTQDSLPGEDVRSKIHVVQHSEWNETNTTPRHLDYVQAEATYHKIPDGNAVGNGTPGFRSSEAVDWRRHIRDPALVDTWTLALQIADRYNGKDGRYTNPDIDQGGMDFSDVSETCWIFGFEDLRDTAEFFETFGAPAD